MDIFYILFIALILSAGATCAALISMFKTSREKAKLEVKLKQQEIALTKETARVQRAFLNMMSHEVLMPMNAIINMADMALRDDNTDTIRVHNIAIKQAAKSMFSLFTEMMDLTLGKYNHFEIRPEEYYFSALINDIVNVTKMRALYAGLRFLVNVDKNIPHTMYGDGTLIRQIFIHLLNNSIIYTNRDFGHLSLNVMGEMSADDTVYLTIEITDTGQGIPDEQLRTLFDDTRESGENEEGTGRRLTMPMVQKIIKAMGGDIRVLSKCGEGTTFTVVIPQKVRHVKEIAEIENPGDISVLVYERRTHCAQSIACTLANLGVDYVTVTSSEVFYEKAMSQQFSFIFVASFLYDRALRQYPGLETESKIVLIEEFGDEIPDHGLSVLSTPIYIINVANMINGYADYKTEGSRWALVKRFTAPEARVLVVDDIYTNLQITTGRLLPYGMKVDLCLNGEDAIEHIKKQPYDIVFMDHMMPDMNGIETVARIHALGISLPIIALTANTASDIREMLLANGMNDYLAKPIDTVKLNIILEKWLPKEKQVFPEPVLTIGRLDTAHGIAMTGGDVNRYRYTLAVFLEDSMGKPAEIRNCIKNNEIQAFTVHVHALKSVLYSIGAVGLSSQAKELEAVAKQENKAFIETNAPVFLQEFEQLLQSIKAALSEAETAAAAAETRRIKNELKTGAI